VELNGIVILIGVTGVVKTYGVPGTSTNPKLV